MSDQNLTNFTQLSNDLEEIHNKLLQAKAIVSLTGEHCIEQQQGVLVQVCFVLEDLLEGMRALLESEMN